MPRGLNGPPNAIQWCDATWNPVTGCLRRCRFGPSGTPCYAETMAKRFGGSFEPTWHPERLGAPGRLIAFGEGAASGAPTGDRGMVPWRIFVGSVTDMMHEAVPAEWIRQVIQICQDCPEHEFIWLTKDPVRYQRFEWPGNCWLGATITGDSSEEANDRFWALDRVTCAVRWISAEPLLGRYMRVKRERVFGDEGYHSVDWVVIGGMSGAGAVQPEEAWVDALERECDRYGVAVFHKDNLACRRGDRRRMEFPVLEE